MRRGSGGLPRTRWQAAVPAMLVIAGVLLITTARNNRLPQVAGSRHSELADLVAAQQARVVSLAVRDQRLADQVQGRTARAGRSSRAVAALEARGAVLAAAAGLEPVRGPALTVSLADASPHPHLVAGVPAPTPDDLVVHQQDVQGVVNALWAGGAEAMTLMGQRVVATTAVRCVGSTLLLGGAVYSPPFTVTAIGPAGRLVAGLDASPAVTLYREYVHAYRLVYTVRARGDVTLPGYAGPVDLHYARAVAP